MAAPSYALKFVQNINGTQGLVQDTTPDYGVGDKDARAAKAAVLCYSANDEKGDRTYQTIVNTNPLSRLEWEVTTPESSWTQGTLLRITIWTAELSTVKELKDSQGIITQAATVVYHSDTNKYWKAIEPSTNIPPDDASGSTYWEEVTDFTTLIDYESVEQFTEDFMVDYSINKCISKGFIGICGDCDNLQDMFPAIKNWALYMSGVSNFQNEAPEKMDEIFNELNKTCATC
jgi:hypothetical protein